MELPRLVDVDDASLSGEPGGSAGKGTTVLMMRRAVPVVRNDGTGNANKGTDKSNRGTDNANRGTDNANKGTGNANRGTNNASEGSNRSNLGYSVRPLSLAPTPTCRRRWHGGGRLCHHRAFDARRVRSGARHDAADAARARHGGPPDAAHAAHRRGAASAARLPFLRSPTAPGSAPLLHGRHDATRSERGARRSACSVGVLRRRAPPQIVALGLSRSGSGRSRRWCGPTART